MALDYVIDWSCPVREQLGPDDVYRVSKYRDMIAYFEANKDEILAAKPGRKLDDVPIHGRHPHRPDQMLTFGTIRTEWEKYEQLARPCCPDCPVNFRKRAIGCYGAVNYPLTVRFEQWMIERYNPPERWPDLIAKLIEEHGITGEDSDKNRGLDENGMGVFEAMRPLEKRIPHLDRPITTTQILSVMMGVREIRSDLCWSLLMSFGAVGGDSAAIDEISELVLLGGSRMEDEWLVQLDPYTRIKREGDQIAFVTSADIPFSLHSEENRQRLSDLMKRTQFTITGEPTDDRPIFGFKTWLLACYVSVANLATIVADG